MWVVGGGQQSDAGRRLLQHVGQPEDLSTIVMIESVEGGAVRGYTRSTAVQAVQPVLRTLRLLLAPWWLAYWLGVMVPRALRDLVYMQVRVVSRRVAEGAEITRRRHKVRRVVSEHKSVFWWRRTC